MKITIQNNEEVLKTVSGEICLRENVDEFGNFIIEHSRTQRVICIIPPGYLITVYREDEIKVNPKERIEDVLANFTIAEVEKFLSEAKKKIINYLHP
jgi:hypothetical protein